VFSKNAEAQAVQGKINSLDAEFERKTAQLLAEQRTKLEAEADVLLAATSHQKTIVTGLTESVRDSELELSTIKADTLLAKDDLKSILREVEIAQDNLVATRKQQEQADAALERTKSEQTTAELAVAKLSTEETRLLESINSEQEQLTSLEQQLVDATTAFDTAKTDREENLRQLDAKLLAVTTDIEQKTEEEEITRRSLAEWQSRLEARDQNLRLREARVAEGETKIVRNSTLLNL
jgi:chromosome segregation ATPase